MNAYTRHREEFIALLAVKGNLPAHVAADLGRRLMRYASTLQRLAVAQCNGDWPADNGERPTAECPLCGSHWARSAITGGRLARDAWHDTATVEASPEVARRAAIADSRACPDCRVTAAVRELVRAHLPMFQVVVTGDPRGYVVRLAPAEATREDINSGRAPLVYVPARAV